MKKPSRTVPRRRQSVSPTPRHLPLVDILIDTQAELQELVVASGLKVLEAMLEEDRAAVCGPRYAQHPECAPGVNQIERGIRRVRSCWAGGRWRFVGPVRGAPAFEEVPLPATARAFANADPLNRRVVDQMLIGVATRQDARSLETARRRRHHAGHEQACGQSTLCRADEANGCRRSWMRGGRRRSTRWTWRRRGC